MQEALIHCKFVLQVHGLELESEKLDRMVLIRSSLTSSGSPNARVLPDPVGARQQMSLPAIPSGIAASCTSKGERMPWDCKTRTTLGSTPRSSNDTMSSTPFGGRCPALFDTHSRKNRFLGVSTVASRAPNKHSNSITAAKAERYNSRICFTSAHDAKKSNQTTCAA